MSWSTLSVLQYPGFSFEDQNSICLDDTETIVYVKTGTTDTTAVNAFNIYTGEYLAIYSVGWNFDVMAYNPGGGFLFMGSVMNGVMLLNLATSNVSFIGNDPCSDNGYAINNNFAFDFTTFTAYMIVLCGQTSVLYGIDLSTGQITTQLTGAATALIGIQAYN